MFSFINIVYSNPSWLKAGAYVKYGDLSNALEWKCIASTAKIAEINVTQYSNMSILLTTVINVDTETRGVFLQNGTYLGNTTLWLVVAPANDQVVALNDNESCKILYTGGYMQTIQGLQKGYIVQGKTIGGYYDHDTGILLLADYGQDPALSKIGFPSIEGSAIFDTNIDLGPRELWPEIIKAMPYVFIVAAFISIPTFIYRRRRQKRRQKLLLAERKQKKRR